MRGRGWGRLGPGGRSLRPPGSVGRKRVSAKKRHPRPPPPIALRCTFALRRFNAAARTNLGPRDRMDRAGNDMPASPPDKKRRWGSGFVFSSKGEEGSGGYQPIGVPKTGSRKYKRNVRQKNHLRRARKKITGSRPPPPPNPLPRGGLPTLKRSGMGVEGGMGGTGSDTGGGGRGGQGGGGCRGGRSRQGRRGHGARESGGGVG